MPDLDERNTSTVLHPDNALEEIQKVLLSAERGRLDRLEKRLRDSVIDPPAVATVLPDAICQRTKQDQHLEKSLVPIIGKIFVRAIKGSPQLIADAISPVMMPAIRKAIDTAVQGMVQSVNQTLDNSGLSWRGLAWRWEAWTTGKSFGEVLLSHTFGYQVERVFLFFRENGVHLADVHIASVPAFESGHEDLVTGMFLKIKTAVQRFAQDEFQASEGASCKALEMNDGVTVLIEQGPKAVLAAVVRGLPSPSLRLALQEELDSIHLELNEALQNFRGDKKPFEVARPRLESCLLHEENEVSKGTDSTHHSLSPALLILLMLPVFWLIWWSVTSYGERQRWANFWDKVSDTPGIHITATTTNGKSGKTTVYGLHDPLSDSPEKIAWAAGLTDEAIDFQLEPYLSLAPELVARRAREVLHAPGSVRLSVSNETRVLNLAGIAPHAWIVQLRKASPTIPGVTSIQDIELQDESQLRLDKLAREIESHHFEFEAGSALLSAEADVALRELRQAFRDGNALAQQLGDRIQVAIHGHTSEEGSDETNRRLALARAQGILSTLNVERLQAIDFQAVAEPVGPPVIGETQGAKFERARRVSFHVTVYGSGSTGARL
ncbi:MAG: OmpA family protein [Nitrospira sp.]|nr:OmpA family protein [Nitrospira sp.]